MTVKSQAIFAALFAYLREQLSAYILPNIIMSEFDTAMQSALSFTFPEATIKGSWFHYTEVCKIIKDLNKKLFKIIKFSGNNKTNEIF